MFLWVVGVGGAAAPPNSPGAPLGRFALLIVIMMIIITVIILNGWMVVAGGLPPARTPPVYSAFGLVVDINEWILMSLLSNQIRWLGRGYPPPIPPSQHLIWLDNKFVCMKSELIIIIIMMLLRLLRILNFVYRPAGQPALLRL